MCAHSLEDSEPQALLRASIRKRASQPPLVGLQQFDLGSCGHMQFPTSSTELCRVMFVLSGQCNGLQGAGAGRGIVLSLQYRRGKMAELCRG